MADLFNSKFAIPGDSIASLQQWSLIRWRKNRKSNFSFNALCRRVLMQKINTSIQRKAIETNNITGWQAQQPFCFDYILADSTALVFRKSKK